MIRKAWTAVISTLLALAALTAWVAAGEFPGIGVPSNSSVVRSATIDSTSAQRLAVQRAAVWLVRTHQNADGGYSSFSQGANQAPSNVSGTIDAILALAAAGYSATQPFPGQTATPIGYLEANDDQVAAFAAADGAQAGKLVLALTAAAVDPRDIGGFDAVDALIHHLQPDGSFGATDVFKQATAVLGMAAANESIPPAAQQWIVDAQAIDGSWDDGFGTNSNPDASSIAIMALLAAGRSLDDPIIVAGRDFLASAQLADATWEYGPGLGGNANSTGLAIQALSALGEDWYEDSGAWTMGDINPLEALLAFQGESGAFQADFGQGPFDDFFSTVQVLPAAAGRPLPLPARFEATRRALTCLESLQDDQSGGWEQFAGAGVSAGGTARAIEAIHVAGQDPQAKRWTTSGGINAIEHLETATPDYLSGGRGGRAGIVLQAVMAAGTPYVPNSFAGFDLPTLIESYLSPAGEYDDTAFGISAHAEAMLGLIAAGAEVDPRAIDFLAAAQQDGDWGDADQNGMAINVLGRLSRRLPVGALAVIQDTQQPGGGWGFGDDPSPSSTSEVAQGLVQIGQNPFGPAWSQVADGRLTSPADAVIAMQGTNGCWPNLFGPGDDPFSTTDAIILLSLQPGWDSALLHLPIISGAAGG